MSTDLCHCGPGSTEARPGCETVVLVGNPNVGKSVVFNALTGTYVDVSNFPGTTVELTRGRIGEHDVVDTPGVYGVSSFNDEETVARDIILNGDIVINVVDAVHLERDLFLTLQLVDMGKRMIVALNMADEARKRGVGIDRDLLEEELRKLVGTIEIEEAEPGATIVIDGQNRGDYPPLVPLRVGRGSHTVRVHKAGFVPFETRVDVAGGGLGFLRHSGGGGDGPAGGLARCPGAQIPQGSAGAGLAISVCLASAFARSQNGRHRPASCRCRLPCQGRR